MNRDEMERRMEALRAILRPAERLTITRTESMVIITNEEGTTTRLAPDGSRIKDDSTGVERRTRWDGASLVTEITGVQGGRITERYAVDPATRQLIVTLELPPRRGSDEKTGQTLRRVYQPQP